MKRTRQERFRLCLLCGVMILFFGLAVARLVQLQVFQAGRYNAIVKKQSSGRIPLPATRGAIYDRYGRLVARDVIGSALCAFPRNQEDLQRIANYLERLYNLKPGTARRRFGLRTRRFRYVSRRISDDLAAAVEKEAPAGLFIRQESRREYPFGTIGRQVLGFTDIDNKGQSGFELAFDSVLAGRNGWATFRRDGLRNAFRLRQAAAVKPIEGKSLVLTLDWRLQEIVEDELRSAVDQYHAQRGVAVFIECRTGDVLAMTHFDPNERHPERPVKCCAITDQFEPGSVSKAFTAAGLLDAGLVDFSDSVYCEEGVWKVGRRRLHDDHKRGWLSFRKVMEYSSNIGIAKYAIRYGGDELVATFRRFGLGEKTNCRLSAESPGTLRKRRWSDFNIAALAMGHSVAVTPLQMAAGFSALANGGKLMKTQLVLGAVDQQGYVQRTREPTVLREVIQPSSLDSLRAFLRGVVEEGTATPVNSSTIAIAGKTGTAQIPNPAGGYFKHRFMASFAGFFPYESPVVAGIVVLTDPRPITYGGYTAGPTFRRIAERYVVSNPDLFSVPEQTLVAQARPLESASETPDLVGRDLKLGIQMAQRQGLLLRSTADKGTVDWQYPPPDRLLLKGSEVIVSVRKPEDTLPIMADLRGMTIRQASAFLTHQGVRFVVSGSGRVVRQSIRAGTKLGKKTVCRLECRTT